MLRPHLLQNVSQNGNANVSVLSYRAEAKTVPNLLVAPIQANAKSEENNLYADYAQGYYADGAYTAAPVLTSTPGRAHLNGGQQVNQDPQEAYYASLCTRFTELTHILQLPPPRTTPDNTCVYYLDWRKRRPWRERLLNTTPTMVILAQLTYESVICGLEVLGSLLTSANLREKKGNNIGAWTWGLLGKCREVGQMGSEEVGVLRNLGKQSVWLLRRISAGEVIGVAADDPNVEAVEEDQESQEEDGAWIEDGPDILDAEDCDGYPANIGPIATSALGHDESSESHPRAILPDADADVAKAKERILKSLDTDQPQNGYRETNASDEGSKQNTTSTHQVTELGVNNKGGHKNRAEEKATIHATLDMLVTIIGEFYGQRDLLDGRFLWDEMQP